MPSQNSFGAAGELRIGGRAYQIYRLSALEKAGFNLSRVPYSIKILLENLLRFEDNLTVKRADIEYVAKWDTSAPRHARSTSAPPASCFRISPACPAWSTSPPCATPSRNLGADPKKANPMIPVDLVIDHSVQVDKFGTADSFDFNALLEFQRNQERYAFLKWGQSSFQNFRVVPPDTGIVHQVNLEYLAPVVFENDGAAYPDTLVGTDSHTTMINGLGVVGWGVGGIEAEACMLGQPTSMLLPAVVGFKLTGKLPEGATATDLVLTVTQMLRKKGVVGKFVEFYGDGRQRSERRRSRHHRQHGARIRRDHRRLPHRQRLARLPAHDQPARSSDRAGGSVCEGARPVPRRRRARARLHRHAVARSRRP